jgi:6-phosphogluconolactonase (cycloisomerase 2 family)
MDTSSAQGWRTGVGASTVPRLRRRARVGLSIAAVLISAPALAQLTISPNSLYFGSQVPRVPSAPQTLTITNTSGTLLTLPAPTIDGTNPASFSVTSNNCGELPAGASCTLEVVFTPGQFNALNASLQFGPSYNLIASIYLAGFGADRTLGVTPSQSTLAFGSEFAGFTSPPQTLLLTNTNSASQTISSISLQGENTPSFGPALLSTDCSTLAVGEQCSVSVEFTPENPGALSDRLIILTTASTGEKRQVIVPVSGLGVNAEFLFASDNIGGTVYGLQVHANAVLTALNPTSTPIAVQSGSAFTSNPEPILGQAKIDPSGMYLYVVDSGDNVIWGFAIDSSTGSLSPVPTSPFYTGDDPQTLAFNASGSTVYVGNYQDGSISAYTLDPASGTLTALGVYDMGAMGQLGYSLPTQMVSAGNYLYVADVGDSVIDVFAIAPNGTLTEQQNYPSDQFPYGIVVNPTGTLLYTANCGPTGAATTAGYCGGSGTVGGTISGYTITPGTGWLTPLSADPLPIPVANFISVDPQGKDLLVTENGGVAVYAIGAAGSPPGTLVALNNGQPYPVATCSPGALMYSVAADPRDLAVYASGPMGCPEASAAGPSPVGYVWEFKFDPNSGVLTAVPGEGDGALAGENPDYLAIN